MAERGAPKTPPELRAVESEADLAEALAGLVSHDPRLAPVVEAAGTIPLRRRPGGFEGLAAIITSQQISTYAAAAIWNRLHAAVQPFEAGRFLQIAPEELKNAGLSRAKISTLTGVAAALADGFDLAAIAGLDPDLAIASLTKLKGVGRWTAEIYLLFCLGHPDIFPAGDLALRIAVQEGLRLPERPDEAAVRAMAAEWSPWRGTAARLFWAYYRARKTDLPIP